MKIRLGYVAISNALGKKVTSSSNVTYKTYSKITSEEKKIEKLKSITHSNFEGLEKILRYNIENDIHFYRLTSALIPLTTHPDVPNWGYRKLFKKDFEYIGKLIKKNNMRVDTHPDQFNVINSANNFKTFPHDIQTRLIIENDDKIYTAHETLTLCKQLDIPMVLDIHHHNCNNEGENIYDMLGEIFGTWNKQQLPPKIHFSSPRDGELDRKHADYIDASSFIDFIENSRIVNTDFDVMLECKEKDIALFKLVDDIKKLRPEYTWIDKTTLEI